jgi:hypothetical protein
MPFRPLSPADTESVLVEAARLRDFLQLGDADVHIEP